jgi:hypothetical protein
MFNNVRDLLHVEPFQKCVDDDSEEFGALKNAGFEDWSEKNCFVFYYMKFFNQNCSFASLYGYSNVTNNGYILAFFNLIFDIIDILKQKYCKIDYSYNET